jgi:hypothetical protein
VHAFGLGVFHGVLLPVGACFSNFGRAGVGGVAFGLAFDVGIVSVLLFSGSAASWNGFWGGR